MEPVSDDAMTTCKVVPQRTVRIRKTNGLSVPLGVTGNTPDSGSGESWFEPRRGNSRRDAMMSRVALRAFLGPTSVLQAFTPLPLLDSPRITCYRLSCPGASRAYS